MLISMLACSLSTSNTLVGFKAAFGTTSSKPIYYLLLFNSFQWKNAFKMESGTLCVRDLINKCVFNQKWYFKSLQSNISLIWWNHRTSYNRFRVILVSICSRGLFHFLKSFFRPHFFKNAIPRYVREHYKYLFLSYQIINIAQLSCQHFVSWSGDIFYMCLLFWKIT